MKTLRIGAKGRVLLAALFFLLLAGGLLAARLPHWLVGPQPTGEADTILHMAMAMNSQADPYVVGLYRQGASRKIICISGQISWQEYPADYVARHLVALGVPQEDVSTLRAPSADCLAELLRGIAASLKSRGERRYRLVVMPEDSRYFAHHARPIFRAEGMDVEIDYVPMDRDELLHDWWRVHRKIQRIVQASLDIGLDQLYSNCR